ncbi:MAG: hypothetical protein HKO91_07420 [Desulfobacterales bacterium]|nr:hypothetical protein [Desulfobacterales bacterium]
MKIERQEKILLDLIAKYTFLEQCNYTGIPDMDTFNRLVFQMGSDNMEKIQYHLRRLKEHHDDTRDFLDNAT